MSHSMGQYEQSHLSIQLGMCVSLYFLQTILHTIPTLVGVGSSSLSLIHDI